MHHESQIELDSYWNLTIFPSVHWVLWHLFPYPWDPCNIGWWFVICCQMKRGTSLIQSVLMFFLMISRDREVRHTVCV